MLAAESGQAPIPSAPEKILIVTLNSTLAKTRELLFTAAGYAVAVALSFDAAVQRLESGSFDLIVIGHGIPLQQRKLLLREIRRRGATPVLGLYHPGESPLEDADYLFDATESTELLLKSIHEILRPAPAAG